MSPIQVTRYLCYAALSLFAILFAADWAGETNVIKEFAFHIAVVMISIAVYGLWAFGICQDPTVVLPRRYDADGKLVRHN